jgi:branched-chain amino acid transport system substrate-binding protein
VTLAVALAALLATGLAACSEDRSDVAGSSETTIASSCSPDDLFACAQQSSIADLLPEEPTRATGEPLTIGMINQENTPAGSFPELSQAAQGFAEWINEELGGVDGRPLVIEVCNTQFTAEGSTACGQQFVEAGVPVVLGGIDVFGNSIDTLTDNGIPFVGGIPVSKQSMTSPLSFQFSGGTWGAAVAMADFAVSDLDAESVSIIYGDFGSIADGARAAQERLEELGATVQMVPYPVVSTDLASPLQAAAASDPDAIFVLAADSGCKAGFEAARAIGVTADLFFTGACASPTIIESADGAAEGVYFNVEGEVDRENPGPDMELYSAVLAKTTPDLDPIGAATVSARSMVNLWAVMAGMDGETIDGAAIAETLRAQVDASSFMGHPYTCDGKQIPELPATCSPQQIMTQLRDGQLEQVSDWIDPGQ